MKISERSTGPVAAGVLGPRLVQAGDRRGHGAAIRNRLAVRIAGSHPADRGSIPRYGSNHMVYGQRRLSEIPVPQTFFFAATPVFLLCLDDANLAPQCPLLESPHSPSKTLTKHTRRQAHLCRKKR